MVGGLYDCPKPEIYTYTFPEHPIFSGTCNGAGAGLVHYYPDMDKPRREDGMNHVFLLGYRFDVLFGRVDPADPFHQYMRALIALRQRIKADTYTGDFRDEIGLGPRPALLDARLFRNRARTRLVVTLLDRRTSPAPCTLTLDLAPHDFAVATAAMLLHLDGTETILPLTMDGTVVTLPLPPLGGEVAAIVIETT
jgi:hypothetical protein